MIKLHTKTTYIHKATVQIATRAKRAKNIICVTYELKTTMIHKSHNLSMILFFLNETNQNVSRMSEWLSWWPSAKWCTIKMLECDSIAIFNLHFSNFIGSWVPITHYYSFVWLNNWVNCWYPIAAHFWTLSTKHSLCEN